MKQAVKKPKKGTHTIDRETRQREACKGYKMLLSGRFSDILLSCLNDEKVKVNHMLIYLNYQQVLEAYVRHLCYARESGHAPDMKEHEIWEIKINI